MLRAKFLQTWEIKYFEAFAHTARARLSLPKGCALGEKREGEMFKQARELRKKETFDFNVLKNQRLSCQSPGQRAGRSHSNQRKRCTDSQDQKCFNDHPQMGLQHIVGLLPFTSLLSTCSQHTLAWLSSLSIWVLTFNMLSTGSCVYRKIASCID